jgi:hypothetical protein
MFLMNYLFDFNRTDAIFSGDAGGVLLKSKNWLKLNPTRHLPTLPAVPEPGDPFPAGFNPEVAFWEDQGDMDSGTLLIGSTPPPATDEGNVGIRIIPDPTSTFALPLGAGGATLTLVVCFGKPSPARQPRSSPFELAPGIAKTTFTLVAQPSNTVDSSGNDVGWFLPLGLIKFRPTVPPFTKHRTFRFEFSVGIEVVSGTDTRHFSHDPDMDIGV